MLEIILNSLIIGYVCSPLAVASIIWIKATLIGDTIGVV